MKFTLRKRKCDKRDFNHVKTLGAGNLIVPPTGTKLSFVTEILDQGQVNECTAFAAVAIRAWNNKKSYDPQAFWEAEKQVMGNPNADGADLQTQGATGVSMGWKPTDGGITDKASAYIFVKSNPLSGPDMFDTLRAALSSHGPLSGGLDWFNEWSFAPGGIIPHSQVSLDGGHDVKLAGLDCINGIDYIVIQNSWGSSRGVNGLYYLDRYMANKVFDEYGVLYWVNSPYQTYQRTGLFEALLTQFVNFLKNIIALPPKPIPPVVPIDSTIPPSIENKKKMSRISDWAKAIQSQEGGKPTDLNMRLNNPGNLKYSSLTASWGGVQGHQATDGGWICKFDTYEKGLEALCNFLTVGAEDHLLAFHESRTLRTFTKTYACPPNDTYATNVAALLGVPVDEPVANLL